jgi:UDP-glucose 4-epimerase
VRVTVTGGAGYIGSVVAEVLLRDGHDVHVIDNLVKGHRAAVSDAAVFARLDLADRHAVASSLRDFGSEAVIHMAAYSLVGESVANPAKYYANNLTAGLSLLEAMQDARVTQLVFSSTAAVYGEPTKQPIEESDDTAPTNPYGQTKLAFEHALRWYAGAYGMRSISLRYFNAAGATERNGEHHEPETHLIPLVLQVAAGHLPYVTVFGTDYPTRDGTCVRDYIHVEDLARAHVQALEALREPGTCRAYNLGCGGEGYSVRDVIETAERVTGRRIPIQTADRRAGDPAVLIASSKRIEHELGWRPQRQQLETIIASAWEHLQQISRARSEPHHGRPGLLR